MDNNVAKENSSRERDAKMWKWFLHRLHEYAALMRYSREFSELIGENTFPTPSQISWVNKCALRLDADYGPIHLHE